jgi:hypothetical protein
LSVIVPDSIALEASVWPIALGGSIEIASIAKHVNAGKMMCVQSRAFPLTRVVRSDSELRCHFIMRLPPVMVSCATS